MDWNTLTIVGSVAASSFGVGYIISDKLSKISKELTSALTDHKEQDSEKFHDHSTRLSLLELQEFGFTHSGKHPDKMDIKTI